MLFDIAFLIGQSLLKRVDSLDLFSSIMYFFNKLKISLTSLHVLNIYLGNISISD